MKLAFFIVMAYAFGGVLYFPSQYSLFTFVFVLVSSLPFYLAGRLSKYRIVSNYSKLRPLIFFSIFFLGIINLGFITSSVGVSFLDIFSLDGIKSIAIESTTRRYGQDPNSHSGNPIILAFSLWLVFRSGTQDTKTSGIYTILAFMPILMYTILTTEKWPSFLGVIFFVTGLIVSNDYRDLAVIFRRKAKYGVMILILMLISLLFRGYQGGVINAVRLIFHYLFAQYSSFGYWYFNVYDFNLSLGKFTFIGLLDYLGITARSAGVFAQSLTYYGEPTNIYTAFRYVVEDFSVLGPLMFNVFFAFLYVLFNYVKSRLAGVVNVFVLFCAFLSTNTTPFVHNSVMLGIVLVIGSEVICRKDWFAKG